MASGTSTSTSTQETSSAVIEDVIMDTSSGVALQQATSKQKESEKKPTVLAGHTDTTSKDDVSDIVSQTRSGSAPVSVISSAQSMDPSKKDSGM